MKRAKTHYAERGAFRIEGASKSEAKANLDSALDWICEQPSSLVETRFGLVLFVSATLYGYETRVIDPAELDHGKRFYSSCQYGRGTFADMVQHVRNHAAQYAWKAETSDDSAFVAMTGLNADKANDLARWIKFQRSYIEFRSAGHTPNECHRLACEASYN
jgi:hypothetical protein